MSNTITTDMIKAVREASGAGMSACKAALVAAGGEFDAALAALRISGAGKVEALATRSTASGLVAGRRISANEAVLVELRCESDFVAKSESFIALGELALDQVSGVISGEAFEEARVECASRLREKIELGESGHITGEHVGLYLHRKSPELPAQLGVLVSLRALAQEVPHAEVAPISDERAAIAAVQVAQQAAAMKPRWARVEELDADVLAREHRIAHAQAQAENKPEDMIEKIVQGKVARFLSETVLSEQVSVHEDKKRVRAVLAELGLEVEAMVRVEVADAVETTVLSEPRNCR